MINPGDFSTILEYLLKILFKTVVFYVHGLFQISKTAISVLSSMLNI
ncbi:MAG: hypothetical protein KatS3mg034_0535 [Vicingaceae bacterium]|nr:MAG: hypothetical protein KatS3mg034_0535 [Vicingaceae bacterium]